MTSTVKTALNQTRFWVALTLGRAQPISRQQHRYVRFFQASLSAIAGRGLTLLVGLVSVPLTVRYLGAERYGVWMAISTVIAWLYLVDFGLGNGLTNAVSRAYAAEQDDVAQQHIATTFWSLIAVSAGLALILAVAWSVTDWADVLNVRTVEARREVNGAVALAFGLFVVQLPLSIIPRIFNAYQRGAIGNTWAAAGNLVSLLGIVLVTQLGGGLVWLIVSISATQFVVSFASAVWLFTRFKPMLRPTPSAFRRELVGVTFGTGAMFFVMQIAALIILQTDNLIIARYAGASAITSYSVTWRLFTYTTMVQTLTVAALWPAYAEAYARGEIRWVQHVFWANLVANVAITLCLMLPLIVFGQRIIAVWAGEVAVPPQRLLNLMGVWSLIYIFTNSIACLLGSVGRIKGQMVYGTLTALVNLVLSIVLIRQLGIVGVILATIIAYAVCNIIPSAAEAYRLFRHPKQGKV